MNYQGYVAVADWWNKLRGQVEIVVIKASDRFEGIKDRVATFTEAGTQFLAGIFLLGAYAAVSYVATFFVQTTGALLREVDRFPTVAFNAYPLSHYLRLWIARVTAAVEASEYEPKRKRTWSRKG